MCFILSSARLRSPSPYWVISFIRTAISPKACTSSSALAAYRFKEIKANSKAPCVGVLTRPLVVVPIPIVAAERATRRAAGWLERLIAGVVAASLSASAQPRRTSDFRRAHPSAVAKPVSESTVDGECPFGELSLIFSASPLVVVPLQFLLLLLFHGNGFLQRDISSIAAHHSVRLDKPA